MDKNKAVSLIGAVIAIAFVCLTLAFFISKFLQERIRNNEAMAQQTLKTISLALEKYAQDHEGRYPEDEKKLLSKQMGGEADLPYLNRAYCGKTENGYTYNCEFTSTGYILTARPLNCITLGTKSFTFISGRSLSQDDTCIPSGS
ncbi:MAG: hypothetical protein NC912_01400 [Candidatus Omnitrophica bacterium]|nr:hypothetical protein [Candidatus Omnitrophota bacterium]